MSNFLEGLYKNQSLIYKYILYFFAVGCIVFFFPKGGKFKYEFQKGKPWQYENLYAPFDFAIRKSSEELSAEREELERNRVDYYTYDTIIAAEVIRSYEERFSNYFSSTQYNPALLTRLYTAGYKFLQDRYTYGILQRAEGHTPSNNLYLVKQNEAIPIPPDGLQRVSSTEPALRDFLRDQGMEQYYSGYQRLFFEIIRPNVTYDQDLSEKELEEELSRISTTRGNIDEGRLIIAKGEVVEAENFKILNSLKAEYESELWSDANAYFIVGGYALLVALSLLMLLLFLRHYRPEIYRNNVKVTFIFMNILLMVFITTLVVKYNEVYVFIVPLCILPLILKTFFDPRLGLFVHVLTVLILGFVVPNSFEYIFLQILAGIVTILTVSELYRRANLFITVGQITLVYIVGYFAFHIIQEGNVSNLQWFTLGFFLLNGMITLFVQPLIYIYEKIFGMVSDVSLLELTDTNSRLLKDLANKAPGTFHHSLQVANIAEAAANEIGANALLVRVGALYHDIGKMNNPTYFTENQTTNLNPHDELTPTESARIIIAHVLDGIQIAQKNNLPDRVIDFIRVHHGTTRVHYFYRKQESMGVDFNEKDFRYPGPIPFSKETAVLMMADAVEAASRSLSNPTFTMIEEFVEKIVGGQMQANQFLNANITFREITQVKKVLKQKLTNIYHLRVEYPE